MSVRSGPRDRTTTHDIPKSVGDGNHRYELIEGWAKLPSEWPVEQTGIVTDSADRVYLFMRGAHPLIVLEPNGAFVTAWDTSVLTSAHGIAIDDRDDLYLPVFTSHVVYKFDRSGRQLLELGSRDDPADTGWPGHWWEMPERVGRPFNTPTDVHVAPDGDIFVSDGYGNARIHRFDPNGVLKSSWGRPGTGPGEFHVPHGIWVHRNGRVYVADRENNRVQVFTSDGDFLHAWPGLGRPADIFIDRDDVVFVAEMDEFVSLRTLDGEVITRWPNGNRPGARELNGAHAIWVDSRGDVYVNVNVDGHRIEKYRRAA